MMVLSRRIEMTSTTRLLLGKYEVLPPLTYVTDKDLLRSVSTLQDGRDHPTPGRIAGESAI